MNEMTNTIYDADFVDKLVENDEISPEEAGFMHWYDMELEGEA